MPNGHDRNWVRLTVALEGFYDRYGRWPTRVRLHEFVLEDLRDHLFSPAAWARIEEKLRFVADDVGVIAEDDQGAAFNYGSEGGPANPVPTPAREWLGVEPDMPHADDHW
jgi:hypothetical protein